METPTRLTTAWAARFALADAPAAATLRHLRGVRAAVADESLWLRGDDRDEALDRLLNCAAPADVYEITPPDLLTPRGRILPTRRLPEADWRSIADVLAVAVPPALAPGSVPPRVTLRLERSSVGRPAAALLCAFERFADWCDAAPAVRLERLTFALRRPLVLVIGTPLPPLPGTRLFDAGGVYVPAGYALVPETDPAALREILALAPGDCALFDPTGWRRIAAGAVVPVTRQGVRRCRAEVVS